MIFSRLFGKKSTSKSDKKSSINQSKKNGNANRITLLSAANREQWLSQFTTRDNNQRLEKIQQCDDIVLLHQLECTADVNPTEKQAIKNKLELLVQSLKQYDSELSQTFLSLVHHSDSIAIKRKIIRLYENTDILLSDALEKNQQQIIASIAAWDNNASLRQKAVKQVIDGDALRMIIKHSADKSIAIIAKDSLTIAKQAQKDKSDASVLIADVLSAMKKISNADVDNLTQGRVNVLTQRWQDINAQYISVDNQRDFKRVKDIVDNTLHDYHEQQRVETQKQDIAEQQRSVINTLCQHMLAIENTTTDACTQFESQCQSIDSQWQYLMSSQLTNHKLVEDYANFSHHAQILLRCMKVMANAKHKPVENFELTELGAQIKALKNQHKDIKTLSTLTEKISLNQDINLTHVDVSNQLSVINEYDALCHNLNKRYKAKVKKHDDKIRYVHSKIAALKSQIQQKNLLKANKLFHYIEKLIEELDAADKANVEQKVTNIKPSLQELRGLHSFVTLPKKEQLCQAMEALAEQKDNELTVESRQQELKRIQQQWRSVMSHDADSDDVLWERFHLASDRAYEPIKHHFEELNQLRHENLVKRKNISDQLQSFNESTDWSNANWKQVMAYHKEVLNAWQQAFPIFYSDNKPLQVEFDKHIKQLRFYLDKERSSNIERKEQLLNQAVALIKPLNEHAQSINTKTDNENAIELPASSTSVQSDIDMAAMIASYQQLQGQWKEVGIVFVGPDRKLWKKFSAIGDEIFNAQRAFRQQQKTKQNQDDKSINSLVSKIYDLAKQPDDVLPANHTAVAELKSQAIEQIEQQDEKHQQQWLRKLDQAIAAFDKNIAGMAARKFEQQIQQMRLLNQKLVTMEEALMQSQSIDEASVLDVSMMFDELHETECKKALALRVESIKQQKLFQDDVTDETIEAKLLHILIDCEVRLDLPTPEEHKADRMSHQLNLLGKGVATLASNDKKTYLHAKECEFYYQRAIKEKKHLARLASIISQVDASTK